MAEEKPHDPTAGKIRKARREGNVPKSAELDNVFGFAVGAAVALSEVPYFIPLFRNWFVSAVHGKTYVAVPVFECVCLSLLPMLVAGVTAAVIGLIQTNGPVSKPFKFDLTKINPIPGLKRMFSKDGIVNAVRAFFAFILAVAAIYPLFAQFFARGLLTSNPYNLAVLAHDMILRILAVTIVIGLVFAGLDMFITRQRWRRNLRMTHEEVKREFKENNGDPQIKGKRRQFHRQLLRGSPKRVQDAAVVVTNPTHFAVALAYDPPKIPVPRVLCRAADEMAFEVRRLAELHGVPIVEHVPLARTLFARGQTDREIPEDTFIAVAEIVAALIREDPNGKIARSMSSPVS